MRLSGKIFVMTLAALQTAGAVEPQPQASAPVSLVHRFTLPGTLRGHFDHFTVDPVGKRLFGIAVEDQRAVVFDFEQGRVLKEIQGVHIGELRLEGIEIEGMTVETQVLVFKVASAIDTRKSPFES